MLYCICMYRLEYMYLCPLVSEYFFGKVTKLHTSHIPQLINLFRKSFR